MQQFSDAIIIGLLINVCASVLVAIFARQLKRWVEDGPVYVRWLVFASLVGAAAVLFIGTRFLTSVDLKFSPHLVRVPFPHWTVVRDIALPRSATVKASSMAAMFFVSSALVLIVLVQKLGDERNNPWEVRGPYGIPMRLASASNTLLVGSYGLTFFRLIVLAFGSGSTVVELEPSLLHNLEWLTILLSFQMLILVIATSLSQTLVRPALKAAVNISLAVLLMKAEFMV